MLASCDIETSCGVETCPGFGLSNSSRCEHAVHHKHNKIDIIGVYDGTSYFLFTDVAGFNAAKRDHQWSFVFHNGKFDYKTLREKGAEISLRDYVGDTQLLGACLFDKVEADWLKDYNEKRAVLNAALPPKLRHRVGTPLSLKAMAPYYLDTPPFWENPSTHDDPEYNRLDCIYTYQLHAKLLVLAEQDGTKRFYENYLIPWQKLLCEAEFEGVLIDEKLLHKMYGDAVADLANMEMAIHAKVQPAFDAYRESLIEELRRDSDSKCESFLQTRIKDMDKVEGVRSRYELSLAKKIERLPHSFNLNSPPQMLKVLEWAGIDTAIDKRDKETNEWIESEGTNKYVLKRAKVQGNEHASMLLEYREKETEVSYLKQYINAVVDGRIYCNFSIVGTRTGRLSSSGPNLQNVKGSLRAPFIIADPEQYSIYTVDSSQIEPRVIAYLSGDTEMVKLFQDGRDYHNYATKKFFPVETEGVDESEIKHKFVTLRKTAKIGDLSIIYGTAEYTFQTMALLREEMDIPLDRCRHMIQDFRKGMKGVLAYKKRLENDYKEGVRLQDRFGFPVIARDFASVKMTLFNTYVQGMASRMIFHASLMAYRTFRQKGIDAKPLVWVHDEVIWRFPKGMALECKEIVDNFMKSYKLETPHGRVPLDVEGHIADRWQK